jgi:hypothetical protein
MVAVAQDLSRPAIQLRRARNGRTSVEVTAPTDEELRTLQGQFESQHCCYLPKLLGDDVLERVMPEIERAEFKDETARVLAAHSTMQPNRAGALMLFLVNDQRLFELVRKVTGCERIGHFAGRVYRMAPTASVPWHDDLVNYRIIAMSINLSPGPFEGGTLQLRSAPSGELLHEAHHAEPGDAIIFRLADYLHHRVTRVEGSEPRIAFAGWFKAGSNAFSR